MRGVLLMVLAVVMPWVCRGAGERLVCLGDSITDGYTYGQILSQAWREGEQGGMAVICAGSGGDTAAMMAARLERDVLRFRPEVVSLSAGTNDALRGVAPDEYDRALREIARKVKASGASMILLTPCVILPRASKSPEAAAAVQGRLDAYEGIVREVADAYGWPVAENRALMERAVAEGVSIMTGDGIHPNYAGQALMARAILNAMGQAEVALPERFAPQRFPGIVREWQMRLAPLTEKRKPVMLTADEVAALRPDDTWKRYRLEPPGAGEVDAEEWKEQVRVNGFATDYAAVVGKGPIRAVAEIEAAEAGSVWINTGGGVRSVWLNGVKLHDQGNAWTGYHAGKERLEARLEVGRNHLVIEVSGNDFFLSVTEEEVWEASLR